MQYNKILTAILAVTCTSTFAAEVADLGEAVVVGSSAAEDMPAQSARTQLTIKEQPKAVQVYDEDAIENSQAKSFADAGQLAPNVVYQGNGDGRENTFSIRGFRSTSTSVDGFKYNQAIADPELFNMERIEILKGADSVLNGSSTAGGAIAVTTKKPTGKRKGVVALEVDSDGGISPRFDIQDKYGKMDFRLVGLYDHDPSWRNFNVDGERIFVAPSATYNLTASTRATLFGEYTDDTTPNDMGTAINPDGSIPVDLKIVNTHPDEKFIKDQKVAGLDFAHDLNADWSTTLKVRRHENSFNYGTIWLPMAYTNGKYTRVLASQYRSSSETNAQAEIRGAFDWQGGSVKLTTGLDYSDANSQYGGCYDPPNPRATPPTPGTLNTIDFANPTYIKPASNACDKNTYPTTIVYTGAPANTKRQGVFADLGWFIGDHVIVSTGLRYEQHEQITKGATKPSLDDDVVIPRVGFTYKATPQTSAFINYGEAFEPSSSRDLNGNLLDPQTSKGVDIGFKHDLTDRLSLSVAAFEVTKNNVAMTDPNNPLVSVASGKQQSYGTEFELKGYVTDRLETTVNYGYTMTEDKGNFAGKEFAGSPKHTGTAWLNYDITPNFILGGGVKYIGKRFADNVNTIPVDDVALLNLSAAYKVGSWKARLNLNNVTNEEYVLPQYGGTARGVFAGQPFNAVATLSYTY